MARAHFIRDDIRHDALIVGLSDVLFGAAPRRIDVSLFVGDDTYGHHPLIKRLSVHEKLGSRHSAVYLAEKESTICRLS